MGKLVDDLLSNIDIVDIVGHYVDLKRSGVNFSACCPFHSEKTPSFVVSPQKQIFKCFGCGKGGDVITFTKEIERIDFRDAVKILAKDARIDIEKYLTDTKWSKKLSQEYGEEKEGTKLIHKAAQKFFLAQLEQDQKAQDYLHTQRKLSADSIEKFQISYAPSSYYDLISYLRERGFSNNDIVQASLGKEKAGEVFSFFRNRIMFPICDSMGNIVAFSGRVLDPDDSPKYLNSSEHIAFEKSKILYGLYIAKQHMKSWDAMIVVEGQMDVIALNRLGYPIGVATSGTALTSNHISIIKRYTKNVYLLFDNDKAGHLATIRALKIIYQIGVFPKIITLPDECKDVDDIANSVNGKEIFQQCFNNAKDSFSVVIERLQYSFDLTSPVEKQKFLGELFGVLVAVVDIAIQDHYLQVLSEMIGMRYEVLVAQYRKYTKNEGKYQIRHQEKLQNNRENTFHLERESLFIALLYKNFIDQYVGQDPALRSAFVEVKNIILKYTTTPLLVALRQGSFSSEECKEREQLQLWREKNLENAVPEKQYQIVYQLVAPLIQKIIKSILGNANIPGVEKQQILKIIAKFKR